MMWFDKNDKSNPVITAQKHINSFHNDSGNKKIGKKTLLFETGAAIPYIEKKYDTVSFIDKLPCFLNQTKCIQIKGESGINYIQGGFGAPSAVDTLETIIALGTEKIVIFGLCGGVGKQVLVGDIIIPNKIIREEGTSYHYMEPEKPSEPNRELFFQVSHYFESDKNINLHFGKTVSTDAVYRQTVQKELKWREAGILGVDMETSALLAVAYFLKIPAVCILIVSDKHDLDGDGNWDWGDNNFDQKRQEAIDACVHIIRNIVVWLRITKVSTRRFSPLLRRSEKRGLNWRSV